MFTTLGLFQRLPCPDPGCHRSPCLFSHARDVNVGAAGRGDISGGHSRAATTTTTAESAASSRARSNAPPLKKLKIAAAETSSSQSRSSLPTSSPSSVPLSTSNGAPILNVSATTSKQPLFERRKSLLRLFNEFTSLYTQLLPLDPSLPSRSALAQESETASTTTKFSYGPAIHSALVEIRGRPKPKTLDSPFIGTLKSSRKKVREEEERKMSQVDQDVLEPYLLPLEEFREWGYLLSVPSSAEEAADSEPNAVGQLKPCSRCHTNFCVSSEVSYTDLERSSTHRPCPYHWGRIVPERVEGRKAWVWSCCKSPRGEKGCEEGLHVFKDERSRFGFEGTEQEKKEREEEDNLLLHRRRGFKTTEEVRKKAGIKEGEGLDIVAIDCEMINTTAGISLARVSVLDKEGVMVLDELVKSDNTIFDLNTRFSGLTREDMESATLSFHQVRTNVCRYIGPRTVVVGHGLENDLKSLRLIHHRIVDTAVLFKHPKGAPFRRSLKDLTTEKLGIFIQNDILDSGHDSSADARAALDLIKWQVKESRMLDG